MRLSILFVIQVLILVNYFPKFSVASYDSHPYGQGPAPPISPHPVANTGWNSAGQAAGSYYHYHVPLVGQQQSHYSQPATSNTDIHQHLLWLIPLLLLLLAPLAFLPLLLKLLLLPVGLSFLALLLPLLMMGGMMMMMMMMGGGGGMMMMRQPLNPVTTARTLGQLLVNDWSSVFSTVGRAIDFDTCPEKLACELGSLLFPNNSTSENTFDQQGQLISKYVVEQLLPRGKVKKIVRQYKNAFWAGSKSQNCGNFTCQPKFRSFFQSKDSSQDGILKNSQENLQHNHASNETRTASTNINTVKYSYPQVFNHTSTTLT